MSRFVVCLTLLTLTTAAAHAQTPQAREVRTVPVVSGVYMLMGNGGNIGLSIGPDATFIVDDQYAPMVPNIIAAVQKLTDKPVRFVVNTHWHGDHMGGNEAFGKAGSLIVAHDNVRRRLTSEQVIEFFNTKVPPSPKDALPVVTFSDTVTFHINNDELVAFHVAAAHTDGDVIVYWKRANVIHMGDTFFASGYPFIDLGTGGTINGIIAAADHAMAIANDNTKIIPGHGELATTAQLREYRHAMSTIRDRIRTQIAANKTLPQVIAAKPTADFDEKYGKSYIKPEQFVEFVYRSLHSATGHRH
ncbi:MAG TPA: MBL fold metallo-hydrolase [Longimicrobiales bacterium]